MRRALPVLATAAALLAAGCANSETPSTGGGPSAAPAEPQVITVFAAASLTEAFTAMEAAFEAANPGTDVVLNFAGSSALAQQITQGAPADVFASADEANMGKVQANDPRVFATNTLTIAVPAGNPGKVTGLADLPRVTTVVCAPQVPCGTATGKVLAAAGVRLTPASEEQDVKSVLTKVTSDEADAGLVYVTDARAAGDKVEAIDFPEAAAAVNRYPVAVLAEAPNPEGAAEFVAWVLGPEGQEELTAAGFGAP